MADTYDMNTLLPAEALQMIAQRWGSPAFYAPTNQKTNTSASRSWYIHLFTGRMPSPEEFYYGMYFDNRGDTLTSDLVPLHLDDRRIGCLRLTTSGDDDANSYAVGLSALANGAELHEGAVSFTSETFPPVPRNPNSDLSWMLDWSFSASKIVTLTKAAKFTSLQTYSANGQLVEDRPTWFAITGTPHSIYASDHVVDHPTQNDEYQSTLAIMRPEAYVDRQPIVVGTVGGVGSGADLELSKGHDQITDQVAPVSLRIKCNIV
ncbi:MAG: hypothetical protein GY833_22810 [Aestuariibacter sp.]|nr:hypothetical protein [Aestuariibacter sp.]